MTVAHQAPLSKEFSRQEYWTGLPFPSPGGLLNPGIEPGSPVLQKDSSSAEPRSNQIIKGNSFWLMKDRIFFWRREVKSCHCMINILLFIFEGNQIKSCTEKMNVLSDMTPEVHNLTFIHSLSLSFSLILPSDSLG